MILSIEPIGSLQGEYRPPSDKSLTHRSYMFAAIAKGVSHVTNPLRGEDCENTLACMNAIGLKHEWLSPTEVRLLPPTEWRQPDGNLDCGNSGTTMRLLAGLLASRPLDTIMVGDASLNRRPMKRIAEPLRLMGAVVQGDTPPLHIVGRELKAIDYVSPVPSGQIKSCTLLAGLRADGITSVNEPSPSRDHTERMLQAMGAELHFPRPNTVSLRGGQDLQSFKFSIPGDISSAAFLMVAAALVPESNLVVRDLSVNPTRTGLLDVFTQSKVPFVIGNPREELGEPVADAEVLYASALKPFTIEGALVPRLIDEIPVLAVLATQCEGTSYIKDAKELRVKESDRIELVAGGLRAMGAIVETFEDGMAITGPTKLKGTHIKAHGDHRIAMAFAIAGLIAEGSTTIEGAESIATSYPTFQQDLLRLSVV